MEVSKGGGSGASHNNNILKYPFLTHFGMMGVRERSAALLKCEHAMAIFPLMLAPQPPLK